MMFIKGVFETKCVLGESPGAFGSIIGFRSKSIQYKTPHGRIQTKLEDSFHLTCICSGVCVCLYWGLFVCTPF